MKLANDESLGLIQYGAEKEERIKVVNCGQTVLSIAPPAKIRHLRSK